MTKSEEHRTVAELIIDEEFLSGEKEIVLILSDGPERLRIDPTYKRYFNRRLASGTWENYCFVAIGELKATAILRKPAPPVFASEAEEAEFWYSHGSEEFDLGEEVDVTFIGVRKNRKE